jgi:membrane-bound lytic murein transglycosylase D
MKKVFLLIIFSTLIFLMQDCTAKDDGRLKPLSLQLKDSEYNHYLSAFKLPENLTFCGEKIPLEIPEVKERAEREFYLLLQQPGQIILYLKRAGRYFPMYNEIIREMNMPDDIKYLSVAESALYMARSPKNAYGLWQFMEGTAKKMGLLINDYVDERCHPEKSTRAALEYLAQGYQMTKSWMLTAAGYNMGNTGVVNSIEYQSVNDFFELFLNEETSRFIFRIAIIKEVMENAEKYGFTLSPEDIYKPDNGKIIRWKESIPNLANWASQQGTTYKVVKLLNPWILKRELPSPPKGYIYEILIPERN